MGRGAGGGRLQDYGSCRSRIIITRITRREKGRRKGRLCEGGAGVQEEEGYRMMGAARVE